MKQPGTVSEQSRRVIIGPSRPEHFRIDQKWAPSAIKKCQSRRKLFGHLCNGPKTAENSSNETQNCFERYWNRPIRSRGQESEPWKSQLLLNSRKSCVQVLLSSKGDVTFTKFSETIFLFLMKYQHVADIVVEFYSCVTCVKGDGRGWTALQSFNI